MQAHSSTGRGTNANWALIPFLVEMKSIFERLRADPALQDPDYDPVFSDFNLVLDNHGAAVNVTVPKATARIKFRYSAKLDPTPVLTAVYDAAARAGITVTEAREGTPPELPADHPLVLLCAETVGAAPRTAPYGTDASELQALAPCVVLGPGDIAVAHTPTLMVCATPGVLRAIRSICCITSCGALHRGRVGQLHVHQQIALVLLRE